MIMNDSRGLDSLPQIWGPDSEEWNPERFFVSEKKASSVGVFANL
jgi:hypothetical protein